MAIVGGADHERRRRSRRDDVRPTQNSRYLTRAPLGSDFHRWPATRTQNHTNFTPIRFAERQITRQLRFTNSGLISSVNSSGMPIGLSTSKAAPISDILRIIQSMAAATPNMMEPPFKVRKRGEFLRSVIAKSNTVAASGRPIGPLTV